MISLMISSTVAIRNIVKNDDFHQIEKLKDKLIQKLRFLSI